MKRAAWIALSASALGLAGCGDSDTASEAVPSPEVAATATAPAPASEILAPAISGQQFANTAAASDKFEIETSRLAATKASSGDVKKFAQEMIAAHTESTAKLKAAAGSASPAITPAAELSPAQQQTVDNLAAKSGAEFDTAYAKVQVDGHQATLDTLKAYSASGDVPSLKAFATEAVPIVTGHLEMAQKLSAAG